MRLLITTKVTSYARPNPFQIAASLYDIEGRSLQSLCLTIKPDGWEIPADIAARVGIDTRGAAQVGVPIRPAMILIKALTELADEWFAFNAKLVDQSLQVAMENAGSSNSWLSRTMKSNCIMRTGSPLVGAKDSDGIDRDSSLASMSEALMQISTSGTIAQDHSAAQALMHHLFEDEGFCVMVINPAPVGSLLKGQKTRKAKRDMGRNPRAHDEKHLKFIRSLPCASCGTRPAGEAAHLRASSLRYGKPNAGLGAKPSDRWTTPLCSECHTQGPRAQHRVGEEVFWTKLGIDPHRLCVELFEATGDRDRAEMVLIHARGGAFPLANNFSQ